MIESENNVKKAENMDRGLLDSIQKGLEKMTKASTEFGDTQIERGVTQVAGVATRAAEAVTTPTGEPQTQLCPMCAL